MKYGVVVDGYSSGSELVREFIKFGIKCLHVQSTMQIPDMYLLTFKLNDYIKTYQFNNDLEKLLFELKFYNIVFVIAGSEPGVELADLIASNLNIETANPIETREHRRDKFLMYQQLKNYHLMHISQFKSHKCSEIINWTKNRNFPFIAKPLKSAGGDKVRICYSAADVVDAFNQIVNKKPNVLNLFDDAVLIQEYIDAPEIAVNTTQYNGNSYLNEIVQFHKKIVRNGKKIYDYATLIPFEKYGQELIDYAFNVAKALDIQYGPMHAEIFVKENQYVLIEAAARIMGANIPIPFMQECLTHPQSYMTALLYAAPQEFLKKVAYPPIIKKNFRIIFLISYKSGKLLTINHLETIKQLTSFYSINIRLKDRLHITVDYDTSPGLVYLCHEDEHVLELDYQLIRHLETNDMYVVE